jgi:short-subunit dehydrogenase
MLPYKTALITGASSGIGAGFAEALATQGCDLVLVARSVDKLEALAARLAAATGRRVEVVVADLTRPKSGAAVRQAVDALGLTIDLLVNNAGFGTVGPFVQQDADREADEIALNCGAVVDLAHAFLPAMVAAGNGAIINIASSAAFQPMPTMAVYAATKAFVWSFSDALREECRGRGVQVMAVCPGPVDTPFFEATGDSKMRELIPKGSMTTAAAVVDETLSGLRARRGRVIPGGLMKVSAAFTAVLPRALLVRIIGRLMRH